MPAFQTLGELGAYWAGRSDPPALWVVDPGLPLGDISDRITGIWATQPSVRKVVDFIARNVAGIPFHVYERLADDDRRRVTDHPLVEAVTKPLAGGKRGITAFRFWHSIMVDRLLWDRFAALKVRRGDGIALQRIPARRFKLMTDGLDRVTVVRIWQADGRAVDMDPSEFVWDAGYSDPRHETGTAGSSPMMTIAHILQESAEAVAYRRSVWRSGARAPMVIERSTPWSSKEARERFERSWAKFVRGGGKEGGTPVLEDGMKAVKLEAFKPRETADLDGRRLTDIEVASFFHIAPELVGAREGTYSNMDAFRQMLYRDSLGPYIAELEQTLNLHLTPDLAGDRPLYVEAHVEAKLRGSFTEQAQVMQTATGAPWMTRAEARARLNLPYVEGSDRLVVPLNVLVGGQASPRDSGSQNLAAQAPPKVKERAPEGHEKKAREVLVAFWRRQGRVVLSRLGAKAADDWWDEERWDKELTADLYPLGVFLSASAARRTLTSLGLDADMYDEDRTLAYLTAMSNTTAHRLNETTKEQIKDALKEEEPYRAAAHVFEMAETSRADLTATALVTSFAAWGVLEAGRQTGRGGVTKTWVTGENPRLEHALMDGETVPVDEPFSNGSMWPGDGMDGEYGCNCSVEITVP